MTYLERQLEKLAVICRPSKVKIGPRSYNIHKRSLPVGLDQIVAVNFTKDEARAFVKHLKTKVEPSEDSTFGRILYYDIVPSDATVDEKSVFFNYKGGKYVNNSSR